MIYRGMSVPLGTYGNIDYERFVRWGMNAVCFYFYWGAVEPYYDEPGVYTGKLEGHSETVVETIEREVAKARSYGLVPFISSRVCVNPYNYNMKSWHYPWVKDSAYIGPTHDYVNLDLTWCGYPDGSVKYVTGLPNGRTRYCNYLNFLAHRFPGVGIATWHFPYHQQSPDIARRDTYYQETLPVFHEAIRSVDTRDIALSPIHQGSRDGKITGEYFYLDRDYIAFLPVEDKNLLWECNTHDGAYGAVCRACVHDNPDEWNRNYTELNEQWQPAADFKTKHNIRLISLESIGLVIHPCGPDNCPACGVRPIKPSRVEWVEAMLQKQEELNMSWFYHRYEKSPWTETPQEADGSDTAVAVLLTQYAPVPTPTPLPFHDDFVDLSKWTQLNGIWRIV